MIIWEPRNPKQGEIARQIYFSRDLPHPHASSGTHEVKHARKETKPSDPPWKIHATRALGLEGQKKHGRPSRRCKRQKFHPATEMNRESQISDRKNFRKANCKADPDQVFHVRSLSRKLACGVRRLKTAGSSGRATWACLRRSMRECNCSRSSVCDSPMISCLQRSANSRV